jgi:hypothetical protein
MPFTCAYFNEASPCDTGALLVVHKIHGNSEVFILAIVAQTLTGHLTSASRQTPRLRLKSIISASIVFSATNFVSKTGLKIDAHWIKKVLAVTKEL